MTTKDTFTVTTKKTYQVTVSHQKAYDPDDGTGPGYYAWVGEPGDQSGYCFGPYETAARAMSEAKRRVGGDLTNRNRSSARLFKGFEHELPESAQVELYGKVVAPFTGPR